MKILAKYLKSAFKIFPPFRNMAIEVFRNKPFIVICGCTGTGKTKLSIQLAQSLIKSGKKCEIINGDAMQLYKNLDIITNKATESEMNNIKHHLVGCLDSTSITYNVIDYKNEAVQLIDSLLEKDVIPILVGGTHYYIQSVIWELLLDKNSDEDLKRKILNVPNFAQDIDSEIFNLLSESSGTDSNAQADINVKLHDSDIKTEKIYQELAKFDEQSAHKIHPNDRRKLCRALQIYFTFGLTKTDLLDSRKNEKGTNCPLRYKNVCLFVMNCENEILNKRLDERVDQMISNGMLGEIENFRKKFQEIFPNETFKSYSRNYEFGIFQSIGLKEFDDYFSYLQMEGSVDETKKTKLFDNAVLDMKLSTKRYAKTQIRWVKNRFAKRFETIAPIIHEIDTTDLSKWDHGVFNKALSTFTDYLNRYELNDQVEINKMDKTEEKKDHFQFNKCDICDRVFINKFQWECHLNGSKHKKRKENLSKRKKTTQN